MPSVEGNQLSQAIRQKMEELSGLCEGLDEATASRAPSGRWSPKEILSHLLGPEDVGLVPAIQAILTQDSLTLNLDPGNPFFSEKRSRMSAAELLSEVKREYGRIADLVVGLSEEELARKAHVPLFKETEMGEYPTLAMFIGALGEYHVGDHINHMREILQALGVVPAA